MRINGREIEIVAEFSTIVKPYDYYLTHKLRLREHKGPTTTLGVIKQILDKPVYTMKFLEPIASPESPPATSVETPALPYQQKECVDTVRTALSHLDMALKKADSLGIPIHAHPINGGKAVQFSIGRTELSRIFLGHIDL